MKVHCPMPLVYEFCFENKNKKLQIVFAYLKKNQELSGNLICINGFLEALYEHWFYSTNTEELKNIFFSYLKLKEAKTFSSNDLKHLRNDSA